MITDHFAPYPYTDQRSPITPDHFLPFLDQLQLLHRLSLLPDGILLRRNARLRITVFDQEVQLVVHGHQLPAQLQNVAQLGLSGKVRK